MVRQSRGTHMLAPSVPQSPLQNPVDVPLNNELFSKTSVVAAVSAVHYTGAAAKLAVIKSAAAAVAGDVFDALIALARSIFFLETVGVI